MKVAIFVQNNHVLYNSIPVSQYGWRRDYEVIDRSSHMDFDPMNTGIDWSEYDVIFPYGSVQFIRKLSTSPLASHVFYSQELFDTAEWMEHFGDRALNVGGFKTLAAFVPLFLNKEPHHIRPNDKDKAFTAKVFTRESWDECEAERKIENDLKCFLSPVRDIEAEYRCWVIGGKIVEISQYIRDNALNLEAIAPDTDVWKQAQELADIYLPTPLVVMDVVKLRDSEQLLFLEFNSIHSSGWYAGDKDCILDSVIDWWTNYLTRESNESS